MSKKVILIGAAVMGATLVGETKVSANTTSPATQPSAAQSTTQSVTNALPTKTAAESAAATTQGVTAKQAAVKAAQANVNSANTAASTAKAAQNSAKQSADAAKSVVKAASAAAISAANLANNYNSENEAAQTLASNTAATVATNSEAATSAATIATSDATMASQAQQQVNQATATQQSAQQAVNTATSAVTTAQSILNAINNIDSLKNTNNQAQATTKSATSAVNAAATAEKTAQNTSNSQAAVEKAASQAVTTDQQAVTSAQATVDTLTSGNDAKVIADASAKVDTATNNVTQAQNAVTAAKKIVPTFTTDEIATINARNATYAKLEAATKAIDNIYAVQPQTTTSGTFVPGKLTDAALQNAVDWLNYYRSLFGVSSVKADNDLTTQAQMTAAVETAANTMTHGLTDDAKQPSNVSDADWKIAATGAASSNLYSYGGVSSGLKALMYGWLLDNSNAMDGSASVGHRQTMLNPTSTAIGFGTAVGDSALTMNNDQMGKFYGTATGVISFPSANLFPASIVENGVKWSVDFGSGSGYTMTAPSSVTIKNLTTGKTITLDKDQLIDTSAYSRSGDSVAFNVDDSIDIQAGDKYQVSVATDQGPYTYTFKLYDDSKQYVADDTLAKATAALATAQSALTAAKTAYNNIKTQYADKASALETAKATLSQAQTKLANDKNALATAQTANKAAQAKLAQAKTATTNANDALATAQATQSKAQATLITAKQNLANAQAIVTQAGVKAQAKLDVQAQKNAASAQRAVFNHQLDKLIQATPTTSTSSKTTATQKVLPQTGEHEAVYLEAFGLLLGMFGLAGISRRKQD